jgi:hypothetical protein
MKNWIGYQGEILEYKVETCTLTEFIIKNNIQSIDLIKIDVELHEPEVIEGLGDFLNTFKPIMIIEILTQEVADKLNHLIEVNDFMIFHLFKNGEHKRMINFDITEHDILSQEWNFLVFHKSLEDKIKKHTTLYKIY